MFRQLFLVVLCFAASVPESAGQRANDKRPAPAKETVDVGYCRARLQLAEAELERVQKANRRVPRTVPAGVVAEHQQDVDTARFRLRQAEAGGMGDEFAVWLRRAQADFAEARTRWTSVVAVNKQSPGTLDSSEVERMRLRSEVYRLQHERGVGLATASREAQLEWRTELLSNELEQVREDAIRIAPVARSYHYYYYPIYYPTWW